MGIKRSLQTNDKSIASRTPLFEIMNLSIDVSSHDPVKDVVFLSFEYLMIQRDYIYASRSQLVCAWISMPF